MAEFTESEPSGPAKTTTIQKVALYTAGTIFAAGAIGHLVRLFAGFEITIGDMVVPVWVSFPGTLAAGLLAIWMVTAAHRL